MADADRCPNCGSELPPNAPKGLCPRCLLQQGLDSDAFSLARGGTPAATMALASGSGGSSVLASLAESVGPVPRVLLRDSEPATDPGPVVQPGSPEMPAPADPAAGSSSSARSPAAAWAPSSRAATATSAATWPSRSCSRSTATTPS